jgi:hypothetical protein
MAKKSKAKTESYYLRSVAALKRGADKIARATEGRYKLPAGSVHVSITKLPKAVRARLAAV